MVVMGIIGSAALAPANGGSVVVMGIIGSAVLTLAIGGPVVGTDWPYISRTGDVDGPAALTLADCGSVVVTDWPPASSDTLDSVDDRAGVVEVGSPP